MCWLMSLVMPVKIVPFQPAPRKPFAQHDAALEPVTDSGVP
jgi:hypothetical protein